MQYLMLTYFTRESAEAWEGAPEAEQQAEVERHMAWFGKHGDRIAGGHELAWPRTTAGIRSGAVPVVTDGPFLETKEILGGVILIEADSLEGAAEIAAEWPSLANPGATVEVVPPHDRG